MQIEKKKCFSEHSLKKNPFYVIIVKCLINKHVFNISRNETDFINTNSHHLRLSRNSIRAIKTVANNVLNFNF